MLSDIGYKDEDEWEKEHFPEDSMLANVHLFYYYKEIKVLGPGDVTGPYVDVRLPGVAILQTVLADGKDLEWKLIAL